MFYYFRGQPSRSLMGTEIRVLISGIDLNHLYKHFCSYTHLKLLFIFEIQMFEYFRGQPSRSFMGTNISVLVSGIDLNHQCKHFLFYNAYQNMSPSLDILCQSFSTLTPKNPLLRHKWAWQWFYLIDIVTINNFVSIMHYKILIVFKLFVIEFTSLLAPN